MNLESDGESVNSSLTECSDSNASGGENKIIEQYIKEQKIIMNLHQMNNTFSEYKK